MHAMTHVSCGFVFQGKLDPKKLQLQLTGFLEKSTGMFMEELWGLLVDAQSSLGGIPSAFLQDKKQEMLQAKVFNHKLRLGHYLSIQWRVASRLFPWRAL